ncbi:hypothetical protein OAM70_03370, partial [Pelagibacteraceae bacterium]|nr:hypothetical protein [Pelagibacteraceae bacterium]
SFFIFFFNLILLTILSTLGLLLIKTFSSLVMYLLNLSKFLSENIIVKIFPISFKQMIIKNLISLKISIKNKKFGKIPEKK